MTRAGSRATPAFSIAANNYLALATVWAESYRHHHPDAEVYVCLADRRDPRIDYRRFPFETLFLDDLPFAHLESLAFRYDILELSTAVKPTVFRHLRDALGHDRALYFDPDILVTDRLAEVEEALDGHQAVLTPHLAQPLDNQHRPSERQIRMMGVYNLGFAGLRLDATTTDFLAWWEQRLDRFCLVDPWHGTFVDQGWMDFAPAFLERVAILRSPRLNVAYWNLPQRRLVGPPEAPTIDGRPLGFFHFSGIDLEDLSTISRHQDRLPPGGSEEVRALFAEYRRRVLAADHRELEKIPYGYAHFEPGHLPVPVFLRRELLRLDPHARRFSRPFDRSAPDEYFAWLTAPLEFRHGTLNRAALALWESRPELVARFPDVCHDHLPDFVRWLRTDRGGIDTGLPPEMFESIAVRSDPAAGHHAYQQEPLRVFVHLTRPESPEWIEAVDLAEPGSWRDQLLETFPGAPAGAAALTRLAMVLWERHRGLQRAFPDPLGDDALPLARWIADRGGEQLGLADELTREHARRLPADVAGASAREVVLATAPDSSARTAQQGAGGTTRSAAAPRAAEGVFGVSLLARFRSEPESARFARGHAAALAEAAVPHTVIDLDADLLGGSVEGLFAPPEGCQLPVLLTHVGLRLAPWVFGWLPAASIQGGRRIGYLDWEFEAVPPHYAQRLDQWDELWTPSEHSRAAVAAATRLPVRLVRPCVPRPAAGGEPPIDLAQDRPWLVASFRADDPLEREDPWTLLSALRNLKRLRPGLELGLVLRVEGLGDPSNPASPAAETLAALEAEAADVPLRIHHGRLDRASWTAVVERAAGFVSLHRTTSVGYPLIEALHAGIPVVATDYGGSRDYLDEETGYPVRGFAWSIGRSLGPVPGSMPCALADPEDAARRIADLLEDPAEGRRRALRGRERVRQRYSTAASGARLLRELDRVRDELS